MLCKKRVIFLIALCIYSFLFLLLILYWMYTENNSDILSEEKSIRLEPRKPQLIPVEIWGKASISLYLWKHILKGKIESLLNGFMNIGNLTVDNFEFTFKNGPGFIQTTVPQSVEYLVLVLNGRSPDKVEQAEQWLKYLKNLRKLKKVCVVLLGSEECDNEWVLPFMKHKGGHVDVVFLVYDSTLVDDKDFFQWPLGVAEYRGFPLETESSLNLLNKRRFVANFVGTVYESSSREAMVKIVKSRLWSDKIRLIERRQWSPGETDETKARYLDALRQSDLTLSPVGMNTECYRIYEALSQGSVPVVEDVMTPGYCDSEPPSPLRLLKQFKVPVIWVSNWTQLSQVLLQEQILTFREITQRRIQVVAWYKYFRRQMKEKFLYVLKNKFLN